MSIPTSEKRFTRSEVTPLAPLSCACTPSPTTKDVQGFSKSGRKVLAELACNDSPVIGLLPPGTPASGKQKSSSGVPVRSRRALLSNLPSHPASTPLGESLLRSQVQLLLQKVESDLGAPPCLRASQHPNVCSGFMVSPTMLAAPTPLNTPAAMAPTIQAAQPISAGIVQNVSTDEILVQSTGMEGTYVQSKNGHSQGTFGIFKAHVSSGEQPLVGNGLLAEKPHQPNLLSASDSSTTFVSTSICPDKMPLQLTSLLSEVSDVFSPSEIFPGKRVLHFDDDTPCKASPTNQSDPMAFEESGHHCMVRELDDDEVSEWSVHVNVGSPSDKQSLIEQAERTILEEVGFYSEANEEVSSSIHEHVRKVQQKSRGKVDLLWHKASERKATPYRSESENYEEEEDDDDAEYAEQYYYGDEEEIGQEVGGGECDNLCDMFRGMRFNEEESKGLPRGEGKHIRFLYGEGEDEIVEAVVVEGEEEVLQNCTATRLNGLPVPLGRHWRFVQEDEEDDEGTSRSQ